MMTRLGALRTRFAVRFVICDEVRLDAEEKEETVDHGYHDMWLPLNTAGS